MRTRSLRSAARAVLIVVTAAAGLTGCESSATIAVSAPLTLPVGDHGASAVAVTPDGARVLVSTSSRMEVFDAGTNSRLGTYGLPATSKPVVTADGKHAYVTTGLGLEMIDLRSGLAADPLLPHPDVEAVYALAAVTGDGRRVFGFGPGPAPVLAEFDVATRKVRPIGPLPSGVPSIALLPDASRAYVAGDSTTGDVDVPVRVIDLATGAVSELPDTGGTLDVALGPDGRTVYAIGFSAALAIDTVSGTVTRRQPVSLLSGDFAVSPDGRYLFVARVVENTVDVFDMDAGQVVASVPVPDQPRGLALTPDGRRLYVASPAGLTIVNLAPPD